MQTHRSGATIVCGETHALIPIYPRMRQIIASGDLGRLGMINSWCYGDFAYRPRRPEELDPATGGGAVLNEHNRVLLQQRGYVVYLTASVDQLLERTAHDRNRPLLQVDDPAAVIDSLLHERDPLYREIADLVVATEQKKPQLVADEIARTIRQLNS